MTPPSTRFIASLIISEGRTPETIEAIAQAVIGQRGITLIDVRPNRTFNRVTVLFGGSAGALPPAIQAVGEVVLERLDLSSLDGEQKPFGTLDMVSIMPLEAVHLERAVTVAGEVGKSLAERFALPVYFTNVAARHAGRASIHPLREQHYGSLPAVISKKEWRPDLGPRELNPRMGAVLVSARLYHVNFILYFDTRDADLVEELIRMDEVIYKTEDEGVELLKGSQTYTELAQLLGRIETFIDQTPEEKVVRVFCNVPNYLDTPIVQVIEVFKRAADKLGIPIFGLRLTGFVPAEVLVAAGQLYFPASPDLAAQEELRHITLAIQQMELNSIDTFNIRRQVLDYHFIAGGDPAQDHGPV